VTTVEFGRKDAADAVREEYPDALCPDDDRRLKTVRFSSDAPEHVVEEALRRADQSRADAESGPGQLDLTDHEKERIDFSVGHASVPHARSVKAIARSEGVDDWLAYYDPTLRVDEHREVMEQATRDESGRRMDAETSATARAGRAAARTEGEQCDHARDHCEHGDSDACAFLRRSCGFDDEEIEEILGADEPESLPGRVYGALRQLWQRYQIGVANAKEAAAAINELNQQYGRELVSFEELGDRELRKEHIDWEATA
jgi:hypothetical protein